MNRPGVVVIGRNEGERLRRCLRSVIGQAAAVVYVDSNYHIQELHVEQHGHWRCDDLTVAASAPRVLEGPLAGFAWSAANTKQVVYTDPTDSIQELYRSVGEPWRVADLTLLIRSLILV